MGAWQKRGLVVVVGLFALLSTGCGGVISEAVRAQVYTPLGFAQLHADPESHKDRTVIFGGDILTLSTMEQGTQLEILQRPLLHDDSPRPGDYTEGRFMAFCDAYLDPAIYTAGRQITIAGRVLGAREGKIGNTTYRYPLISCLETHLWPRQSPSPSARYYPSPWWYWDPWYRRPFYSPLWGVFYPYYYPYPYPFW